MAEDLSLIHKLAWEALNDRMRPQPDGSAVLAMPDGSGGVLLSRTDLGDISAYLEAETGAARRAAKWGLNLAIPFALFMLSLHAPGTPLDWLSDRIEATSSLLGTAYTLMILMGMPLGLAVRQALVIRRAIKAVDLGLARRPRVAVPPLADLSINAADKILIFIAVFDIVPAIVHLVSPDSLRNTPLVGSTLDPLTVGILVVVAWRLRKRKRLASRSGERLSQNAY